MVYFLLLINLYARFTRYEPWFLSDINHISWIVFILAKFNFTKWLSISPRFQAFHQDDFNFTKSFSISPRVFRFHQESCALGEKNFTKILTKMGGPLYPFTTLNYLNLLYIIHTSTVNKTSSPNWPSVHRFLVIRLVTCWLCAFTRSQFN